MSTPVPPPLHCRICGSSNQIGDPTCSACSQPLIIQEPPGTCLSTLAPAASPGTIQTGGVVGQYRLDGFVGRGGFGFVYRTTEPHSRPACIKIGYPGSGGGAGVTMRRDTSQVSPEWVRALDACADGVYLITGGRCGARLLSGEEVLQVIAGEAELLRQMRPGLFPEVYDSGRTGNLGFYVMEYVDGRNLRDALHYRNITPFDLGTTVMRLLEAMLQQQEADPEFYHGDLKPENILISEGLAPRLVDPALRAMSDPSAPVTATFAYNPLCRLGQSADTFALALILLEAATGCQPFRNCTEPFPYAFTFIDPPARADMERKFLDLERLDAFRKNSSRLSQIIDWLERPPTYQEMYRAMPLVI